MRSLLCAMALVHLLVGCGAGSVNSSGGGGGDGGSSLDAGNADGGSQAARLLNPSFEAGGPNYPCPNSGFVEAADWPNDRAACVEIPGCFWRRDTVFNPGQNHMPSAGSADLVFVCLGGAGAVASFHQDDVDFTGATTLSFDWAWNPGYNVSFTLETYVGFEKIDTLRDQVGFPAVVFPAKTHSVSLPAGLGRGRLGFTFTGSPVFYLDNVRLSGP